MKKQGLLHPELCRTITAMGHTDTLVVADAGLPVPKGGILGTVLHKCFIYIMKEGIG